jgi:hypothetical protein
VRPKNGASGRFFYGTRSAAKTKKQKQKIKAKEGQ